MEDSWLAHALDNLKVGVPLGNGHKLIDIVAIGLDVDRASQDRHLQTKGILSHAQAAWLSGTERATNMCT